MTCLENQRRKEKRLARKAVAVAVSSFLSVFLDSKGKVNLPLMAVIFASYPKKMFEGINFRTHIT